MMLYFFPAEDLFFLRKKIRLFCHSSKFGLEDKISSIEFFINLVQGTFFLFYFGEKFCGRQNVVFLFFFCHLYNRFRGINIKFKAHLFFKIRFENYF